MFSSKERNRNLSYLHFTISVIVMPRTDGILLIMCYLLGYVAGDLTGTVSVQKAITQFEPGYQSQLSLQGKLQKVKNLYSRHTLKLVTQIFQSFRDKSAVHTHKHTTHKHTHRTRITPIILFKRSAIRLIVKSKLTFPNHAAEIRYF